MVSTHLKNISQNGNLPQIGVKIKIFELPPTKNTPFNIGSCQNNRFREGSQGSPSQEWIDYSYPLWRETRGKGRPQIQHVWNQAQKSQEQLVAESQPLLNGWKWWFPTTVPSKGFRIIQLKQPLSNGCLGYQEQPHNFNIHRCFQK